MKFVSINFILINKLNVTVKLSLLTFIWLSFFCPLAGLASTFSIAEKVDKKARKL